MQANAWLNYDYMFIIIIINIIIIIITGITVRLLHRTVLKFNITL